MTAAWGLLIGYGSVGRYHARALASRFSSIALLDAQEDARARAQRDHPAAVVAGRLDDLDGRIDWPGTLAVIATWGPSHAELFGALADRGVKSILCEKPLASSVADAQAMVDRSARERIALGVHHYIRYAGLAEALRRVAQREGLGEPVAMVSEGGACCLLTNGIHLIDFAIELWGDPRRVVSTAEAAPINPRSPDLMLYGGTAVWSFEGGEEAVISFTNRSSLAWTTRVFFRDAVAEFDGELHATVRRRDRTAVEKWPAVTRTGKASELVPGGLEGVLDFERGLLAALRDVDAGEARISRASAGAVAVSACIGALVSSREGRGVSLPIDPASPAGREHWPVS